MGDGELSPQAILALAWAVGGLALGLAVAAHKHRKEAREDAAQLARGLPSENRDDMPPGIAGLVTWVLAPLAALGLLVAGVYWVFDSGAARLARVDRLPEVREARLKEMERDAGL